MKNKKLSYSFLAVALALTLGMLFMGFGPFTTYNFFGVEKFSLWDHIFIQGNSKMYVGYISFKYRAWLIIAFVLMLLAICALVSHLVIKSKNFTGKKLDIAMLASISSALFLASIFVFASKSIVASAGPKIYSEYVKLGWGAIVSGCFGILGVGSMFAWFFTHPAN